MNAVLRAGAPWLAALSLSIGAVGPVFAETEPVDVEWPSDEALEGLDDLSLTQLLEMPVEAASRKVERARDAPAVVTVVTREQIRARAYRNLAQVLGDVTGFYVIDDHVLPDLGVRGVSSGLFGEANNIKVLIDGEAVSFRTTGGHWLGDELLPMAAVERIEIVRGPVSALYGADAFLGVVNVITRRGDAGGGGGEIVLGAGTVFGKLDEASIDLMVGGALGDFDATASLRVNKSERPGLYLPATSPRPQVVAGRDAESRAARRDDGSEALRLQAGYQLGEDTRLSAYGSYSGFSRRAELAPWGQLAAGLDAGGRWTETRVALEQARAGLGFDTRVFDVELRARASVFWGQPRPDDHIEIDSDLYYVERRLGYVGSEQRLELDVPILDNLSVSAGAEYLFDQEQLPSRLRVLKRATGDIPAGGTAEPVAAAATVDFHNVGAFAQVRFEPITSVLHLHGALRFDYHSLYGPQIAGRAAVVFSPLDQLSLKLIYGNAFKAPSPFLLHATPNRAGDVLGNPRLAPQHVHEATLQVLAAPWSFVSVTSDLSYAVVLGLAEFEQQGFNRVARNVSAMTSLAWNTDLRARFDPWLDGALGFEKVWGWRERRPGYQAQLLGDSNPVYPSYTVRAGLTGTARALHLQATVQGAVVGERQASDSNSLEAGKRYELPAYFALRAVLSVVDLVLLPLGPTQISLVGDNLLDAGGPTPGYGGVDYPLTRRTFFLELRQQL